MDRKHTSRRSQRPIGALAACALTALSMTFSTTAQADQLEQHNELVNKFVTEMGANPMVADCAAHADFVVSTSSAFDHVDFPRNSFDPAHAAVTPWNEPFDQGKQRIKVDSIVNVEGVGVRKDGSTTPDALKFRCGYVDSKMLAFSWNDPVAPFKHSASARQGGKKKALRGSARTGTGKSSPGQGASKTAKKQ